VPCKKCQKKPTTTVAYKDIKPLIEELVDRIGYSKTVERTELSHGTVDNLIAGNCERVRKTTARAVILTLYQIRKEMRNDAIAWAHTETVQRRVRAERMLGY